MSLPPVIIVAEPDPLISGALRVEFSRSDFVVLLAETCQDAEDYATKTSASLIVLDASKERRSALEACTRIRHQPGYEKRPIVITATQITGAVRAAAEIARATAVLAKPYSIMELIRAARRHLPDDDPLLIDRDLPGGASSPRAQEWKPSSTMRVQSGSESALARNGHLLPIVRTNGVKIPLVKLKY